MATRSNQSTPRSFPAYGSDTLCLIDYKPLRFSQLRTSLLHRRLKILPPDFPLHPPSTPRSLLKHLTARLHFEPAVTWISFSAGCEQTPNSWLHQHGIAVCPNPGRRNYSILLFCRYVLVTPSSFFSICTACRIVLNGGTDSSGMRFHLRSPVSNTQENA